MTDAKSTYGLSPRVRYRTVGEDGVLVHLENGRVVVVNETGLHIIRQLQQGARTEMELIESMIEEFEVDADRAGADVASFLSELQEERILDQVTSK